MSLIPRNKTRFKALLHNITDIKAFSKSVRSSAMILLSITTLLLTGCGEESNPPAKQVVEEQPSRFSKDKRTYRHSYHPEWPKEVRNEVYGDKETFSTPRILFNAKVEWMKRKTLFSARMDGSDRRRIIPETAFEGRGLIGSHTPKRSPDNRYIALSMDTTEHGFTRELWDTKTQQFILMSKGYGHAHFNWTKDSENVIFYASGKHYNYHVPTKALTERPIIYSNGLYLLPDGKTFLADKKNKYWLHDFNGDVIEKVDLGFNTQFTMQYLKVSPFGDYISFLSEGLGYPKYYWVNLSDPSKRITKPFKTGGYFFSDKKNKVLSPASRDSTELMGNGRPYPDYYFIELDLITKQEKEILLKESNIWGMGTIYVFGVFNIKDEQ
ncbi:hypothetical protein [Pseudoalteromonas sp. BSi20429]|uniref:hypothetical protein n=1 Tax=Pseudoalteromonas sp. BSi20429 TaxID=1097676 RepID=UPI000231A773|nr:hypothetical protein [Pseudoalteromonas sp. BSi20429]GAA67290.1 hypothetical protein P20429_1404 [Pseudoalteromonas sp. BSi20429]